GADPLGAAAHADHEGIARGIAQAAAVDFGVVAAVAAGIGVGLGGEVEVDELVAREVLSADERAGIDRRGVLLGEIAAERFAGIGGVAGDQPVDVAQAHRAVAAAELAVDQAALDDLDLAAGIRVG